MGFSVKGTFTYVGRLGMVSNSKTIRSPNDLMSYSAGTIFSREIFIHLMSSCMFIILLVVFYMTSAFLGDDPLGDPLPLTSCLSFTYYFIISIINFSSFVILLIFSGLSTIFLVSSNKSGSISMRDQWISLLFSWETIFVTSRPAAF
jgi:hypothetical protein